MIADF
jgi:heat shock 70kDa protein 4